MAAGAPAVPALPLVTPGVGAGVAALAEAEGLEEAEGEGDGEAALASLPRVVASACTSARSPDRWFWMTLFAVVLSPVWNEPSWRWTRLA